MTSLCSPTTLSVCRPQKACAVPFSRQSLNSSLQHQIFISRYLQARESCPHSLQAVSLPKLIPANGRHSCPKAENCKQRPKLHPCTLSQTTIICAVGPTLITITAPCPRAENGLFFSFPIIEHITSTLDGCCARIDSRPLSLLIFAAKLNNRRAPHIHLCPSVIRKQIEQGRALHRRPGKNGRRRTCRALPGVGGAGS